jgi:hypothetical protein
MLVITDPFTSIIVNIVLGCFWIGNILLQKGADPPDNDYSFRSDVFCVQAADSLHRYRLFCHSLHYTTTASY